MRHLRHLLKVSLLLFLLGSCIQRSEKTRIPKQYSIEQLYENLAVYGSGFNADETKILIGSNSTGIYNVYELNIADTLSKALTSSTKESFFAVNYLPQSSKFLYSVDKGGDENSHLYLKSESDTSARDLTPWPKSTNSFIGWSADKKSMYVISNNRNPQFFDLWKLDTASWKPFMIYQNDSGLDPAGISKSERYFALTKSITSDKNELYLFDAKNKKMTRISNDNEATWNPMAFEKNDSVMYYTTSDGSEFSYLVKYHINSGKAEKLYEDKWDVASMSLSENERFHTIFVNEDGKNKVLLFDHKTNQPIDFPEIKDGDVLGVDISESEKNLLLTVGSSTSPQNLYVYNLDKKNLKQLTA